MGTARTIDDVTTVSAPDAPGWGGEGADWSVWIEREEVAAPVPPVGRVLLVSYLFPPVGGSGIYRPLGLARHLPACGWSVEVLTAGHARFPWRDETLLDLLPDACAVYRIAGHEPACWAEHVARILARRAGTDARETRFTDAKKPDRNGSRPGRWIEDRLFWRLSRLTERFGLGAGERLWIGSAVQAGLRLHREHGYDAVISTGPPDVAHEVAQRIARRAGIPWLADLRDPLVSDFDRRPKIGGRKSTTGDGECATAVSAVDLAKHAGTGKALPTRQWHRMRLLEQVILTEAATVVTTCSSLAEDLTERYPHRSPGSIRSITNGFDRDELRAVTDVVESDPADACCHFVAAGAFYGRREIARIVEPFQRVIGRHPEWNGKIRLTIAGLADREQQAYWTEHAPTWMTLTGYVDRRAALRLSAQAVCNLILVPDCEHGRLSIPGKTFDLLALPRHVLALAPEGSDTAKVVSAAGAATVVPLEDEFSVTEAFERIITDHFADRLTRQRDWSDLDRYDRRAVARQFAAGLAGICRITPGAERERPACDPSPRLDVVEVA